MAKMKKFMAVHRDPDISWKVQENWAGSATVEEATWIRTYPKGKEVNHVYQTS